MTIARAVLVLASLVLVACRTPSSPASGPAADAATATAQARVMEMADDQIAALGEAMYLTGDAASPRARTLQQSFLRNGVGACLDIGAGPNPWVGMLDLLVLSALQPWSWETHWMPAGVGDAGRPALERLRRAEADMWRQAEAWLSADQLATLRSLVAAWIADNPDQVVVALVRFDEFADERMMTSSTARGAARGLLDEVTRARATIDDARLLGERLLWYAGRLPYVVGEQAELTAFRLADEPELQRALVALEEVGRVAETLRRRADTVDADLDAQRAALFSDLAVSRRELLAELRVTFDAAIGDAIARIAAERDSTIDHAFGRLALERAATFDALTDEGVVELVERLSSLVAASDGLLARFDEDTADEGMQLEDLGAVVRDLASAAERGERLLEHAGELLASDAWAARESESERLVDFIFWRALILLVVGFAGVVAVRAIRPRPPA